MGSSPTAGAAGASVAAGAGAAVAAGAGASVTTGAAGASVWTGAAGAAGSTGAGVAAGAQAASSIVNTTITYRNFFISSYFLSGVVSELLGSALLRKGLLILLELPTSFPKLFPPRFESKAGIDTLDSLPPGRPRTWLYTAATPPMTQG